jgi:hypothetical protein
VAEALQDYGVIETPISDTGTLQTDLLELLCGIITRIQTSVGKVIDQIVVGHYPQPELEEVRRPIGEIALTGPKCSFSEPKTVVNFPRR